MQCMYTSQGQYQCHKSKLFVDSLGVLNSNKATQWTWKVTDPNPVCNIDLPCCNGAGKTPGCKLDYCCSVRYKQ